MMLDELVKAALVGTGRGDASPPPPAGGALGDALGGGVPPSAGPEARLLTAAAVVSAYESCGRVPESDAATPAEAQPDAHPPCTRRAGELLDLILAMPGTPAKPQLLDEWLDAAARVRRGRATSAAARPARLRHVARRGPRASRRGN